MRAVVFVLCAAIILVAGASAWATPISNGGAHVSAQPTGSHSPMPEPDVSRHEPRDPCRQFHTPRAHARCMARHQSRTATTTHTPQPNPD